METQRSRFKNDDPAAADAGDRAEQLTRTMSLGRSLTASLSKSAAAKNVLRAKIISMGAPGCGKSCLIKRYCERRFVTKYITTIGVDYGVKKVAVSGFDVRINFWDLSGQNEFFEIRNEFYKDAQGAILVYDVTNRRSFEDLDAWVNEASKYGARDIPIVVCCNKVDKGKRAVSEYEGKAWAQARGYRYFETSASSGLSVAEAFEDLFRSAVDFAAKLG